MSNKKLLSKEEIQKLITINGELISMDKFTWCSECSVLKIEEIIENLKIDFSEMDKITINIVSEAEIEVRDECTIDCFSNCKIKCGFHCNISAWSSCKIIADSYCTIDVLNNNIITMISYNNVNCGGENTIRGKYNNIIRGGKISTNKITYSGYGNIETME